MNNDENVGYCRSKSGVKILLSDDKDISVIKDIFTVAVDDVEKIIDLDIILDDSMKIYNFRIDNGFCFLTDYENKVSFSSKIKENNRNGYSIHIMIVRKGSFFNSKSKIRIDVVKRDVV